ncbi:hypothetical protein AYJ54_35320 [Bradyrhizobium centrolobii]|uniref:Uncharacterized protein n=1 Tax=Bradyrhizobium centrolobii TaxID=1505087 RepID=A0A176Y6R7_9BRAD|nr:hypothetical protein [Bradyrhizobium centrolobii]OAE97504.1 hypothetical protein AYJ54_35320 [Bradyrhizobium centrolobii]
MLNIRTLNPGIAAALLSLIITSQAFGRGSQVGHDDPWNPEHIDQLPLNVRNAVTHMCGGMPRAAHYFATYLDNSRIIRLHFEHLHCDHGGGFCNSAGCLHQEYLSTGSQYRLIKSYYGRGND